MQLTVPIEVKMDMDAIIARLKDDDFVHVVRCKDCKHYYKKSSSCGLFADSSEAYVPAYGFCYLAERREDG